MKKNEYRTKVLEPNELLAKMRDEKTGIKEQELLLLWNFAKKEDIDSIDNEEERKALQQFGENVGMFGTGRLISAASILMSWRPLLLPAQDIVEQLQQNFCLQYHILKAAYALPAVTSTLRNLAAGEGQKKAETLGGLADAIDSQLQNICSGVLELKRDASGKLEPDSDKITDTLAPIIVQYKKAATELMQIHNTMQMAAYYCDCGDLLEQTEDMKRTTALLNKENMQESERKQLIEANEIKTDATAADTVAREYKNTFSTMYVNLFAKVNAENYKAVEQLRKEGKIKGNKEGGK